MTLWRREEVRREAIEGRPEAASRRCRQPWKAILDRYLGPLTQLLFPEVHAAIDWLMVLSPEMETTFREEIERFEEETKDGRWKK